MIAARNWGAASAAAGRVGAGVSQAGTRVARSAPGSRSPRESLRTLERGVDRYALEHEGQSNSIVGIGDAPGRLALLDAELESRLRDLVSR